MLCAGNIAQIRQSVMSDKVWTNLGGTDPRAGKWASAMPPKPAASRLSSTPTPKREERALNL
jgi:hypothetical protein